MLGVNTVLIGVIYMPVLTNEEVLFGGGGVAGELYRAMVAMLQHDEWCAAYGLDRDDEHGGTWWCDVVEQALLFGDVEIDGNSFQIN